MSELEPPAREQTHVCRCLLVVGRNINRCDKRLPVDQPLCGNCEWYHLTGKDPIFGHGGYMMLVPPGLP